MAIVIPGKNIYSINFNPVIDNQIDKVEVEAITPSNLYDYDTIVYNEDVTAGLIDFSPVENYDLKANYREGENAGTSPLTRNYREAISFVNIQTAYATLSIKVPKNQSGKLVSKIYDKENIKYSLDSIEKETIGLEVYVNIDNAAGYPNDSNISYNGYKFDFGNDQITTVTESNLKEYLSATNTVTAEGSFAIKVSATASKTLTNKENISSISATLNTQDNTWDLLNLKILTGVYVAKAGESKYVASSPTYPIQSKTRTLTGTGEFYRTKKLSITIYGDTINLDLQDKTVSTGNGNKVFSFDGNELIQTTNTSSQEDKYQTIVDKWKNGKQTAAITCLIADYYDTDGNKVIDTSTSTKMLFDIGDIVIPYTYTNQGDKPISYNKDFTPKQFKIVGTNISKKQGVQQVLTVQEV